MAGALTTLGMAKIHPRIVATTQEVDGRVIPHAHHPFLEALEVGTVPAIIVAHQLGSIGETVTVESCGKGYIGVACDGFSDVAPVHKRFHGMVGEGAVTANLPTEGILESNGRPACGVHVIVAREAALHISRRPRSGMSLCVLVVTENLPGAHHIVILIIKNQFLGTVDVGLRDKGTWMYEALLAGCVIHRSLGRITLCGLDIGQESSQRGRKLVYDHLRGTTCVDFGLSSSHLFLKFCNGVGGIALGGCGHKILACL